jgi:cysteinyl-tRNA synthetase
MEKSFVFVKVSDYTNKAIEIIKYFLKEKIAYYNLRNVYLRTEDKILGKISNSYNRDICDFRFDIHPGKQNINDILLWNSTEAFENVFNDSELGNGIPWWHIQDIAVIMCIFLGKYNIH